MIIGAGFGLGFEFSLGFGEFAQRLFALRGFAGGRGELLFGGGAGFGLTRGFGFGAAALFEQARRTAFGFSAAARLVRGGGIRRGAVTRGFAGFDLGLQPRFGLGTAALFPVDAGFAFDA